MKYILIVLNLYKNIYIKYKISLQNREDWKENKVQLPSDGQISYTDETKKEHLSGDECTGRGEVTKYSSLWTGIQRQSTSNWEIKRLPLNLLYERETEEEWIYVPKVYQHLQFHIIWSLGQTWPWIVKINWRALWKKGLLSCSDLPDTTEWGTAR